MDDNADTNGLIHLSKAEGHIAQRLQRVAAHIIQIPSVVWFELESGLLRSSRTVPQRQSMNAVANTYRMLPIDLAFARADAQINDQLSTAGTAIGHHGLFIAGIALAHGLTLVSRVENSLNKSTDNPRHASLQILAMPPGMSPLCA